MRRLISSQHQAKHHAQGPPIEGGEEEGRKGISTLLFSALMASDDLSRPLVLLTHTSTRVPYPQVFISE
jgi:hypothetical protein